MAKRVLTACRDCKNCTNSNFAHAGRKWGRRMAAMSTFGASEVAMSTQGKCRQCGHQMSLHGVDQVAAAAVQPVVQVMYPQQGYPQQPWQPVVQVMYPQQGYPQQPWQPAPPPPPSQGPPPGWYDDAHDPNWQRWWDGFRWTDHLQPRSQQQSPQSPPPQY